MLSSVQRYIEMISSHAFMITGPLRLTQVGARHWGTSPDPAHPGGGWALLGHLPRSGSPRWGLGTAGASPRSGSHRWGLGTAGASPPIRLTQVGAGHCWGISPDPAHPGGGWALLGHLPRSGSPRWGLGTAGASPPIRLTQVGDRHWGPSPVWLTDCRWCDSATRLAGLPFPPV